MSALGGKRTLAVCMRVGCCQTEIAEMAADGGRAKLVRYDFGVFQPLRKRMANALTLGTLIGLAGSFACSAAAGTAAGFQSAAVGSHRALVRATARTSARPQNKWAAQSEIAPDELAAYLAIHDTLRVPFDSALVAIRTCLRGPENTILTCLDEMSGKTACETDSSQCAYAADRHGRCISSITFGCCENLVRPRCRMPAKQLGAHTLVTSVHLSRHCTRMTFRCGTSLMARAAQARHKRERSNCDRRSSTQRIDRPFLGR